jgi:hypothetical protein
MGCLAWSGGRRARHPTVADAICDGVVHNAHVLALRGPSMRQTKGLKTDN